MENFTAIRFEEQRDFGRKISATFDFLRQNFKSLSKSLLFIAGPPALIASIFGSNFYTRLFNFSAFANRRGNPDEVLETFTSLNFWLELIGMFIFLFVTMAITVSIVINYMKEYDEKKTNQISVETIWGLVRNTLGQYIITILFYIGTMIVAYIFIIIIVGIFAAASPILAVFGGIVLGVGLLYLVITFSLLFYIRAFENKGVFESASRCFYLIAGKWWSTFGLLFVIGLIQSTIASVFFIPWYINLIITMMHSMDNNTFSEPSLISQIINNVFLILYFLSSFILYALPLIAVAFQYFNLVELKESKGLLSRIENIGQAEAKPKDEHY